MSGVLVIDGATRVGQLGDQLLDAQGEGVNLAGEHVDLPQQHPGKLAVMMGVLRTEARQAPGPNRF
jgi:hypothetical protein